MYLFMLSSSSSQSEFKSCMLRLSMFEPLPFHHGGNHRTLQIYEILTASGYSLEALDLSAYKHNKFQSYLKGFKIWPKYRFKFFPDLRAI